MPFVELSPEEIRCPHFLGLAQMKILALMIWPHDIESRRSFFFSKAQDGVEARANADGIDSLPIPTWFRKSRGQYVDAAAFLTAADPIVVKRKVPNGPQRTASLIAGEVLLHALGLDQAGTKNITIEECLELEETMLEGGSNKRPKDLRSHWLAYRDVSTFWAAYLQMGPASICTDDPRVFRDFLFLSDVFRDRGTKIRARNVNVPIVDPSSVWRLPPSVMNSIIFPRLRFRG